MGVQCAAVIVIYSGDKNEFSWVPPASEAKP